MAEYIEREAFKQKYLCCGYLPEMSEKEFDEFPTADVAPVTRCKDCKHSWEDIGGLCCSHGACVDLTVPTICQSCGAMMDGEPCTPSK